MYIRIVILDLLDMVPIIEPLTDSSGVGGQVEDEVYDLFKEVLRLD